MSKIVRRHLQIDLPKDRSAFLWGPRKVGKTTWIKNRFQTDEVKIIDLLKTDVYADYASRPALLRERHQGQFTVIDEIQKIPALLDEVHWLMEHKQASFLLTGSSARKLKRGHANMLGGRAWRFEMGPLSCHEVSEFKLESVMQTGLIAPHYLSPNADMDLRSYVSDYLKEEIVAEALTQNIPAFAEFLRVAALTNAELLNYTNVARECGVSAKIVRNYFQILEDTLLGSVLPAWKKSKSRRLIQTGKFYFFDVGLANHLAKRKPTQGTSDFGKSFEHLIHMELLNYKRYRNPDLDISFWRSASGMEVDFILGDMEIAIEVKSSKRIHDGHLRHLRSLQNEEQLKRTCVVCLENEKRQLDDGIQIFPWKSFLDALWKGELV